MDTKTREFIFFLYTQMKLKGKTIDNFRYLPKTRDLNELSLSSMNELKHLIENAISNKYLKIVEPKVSYGLTVFSKECIF